MAVKEKNLQVAVRVALQGPSSDGEEIKIDKHEFNVDKAKITRNGLAVTVNGMKGGDNISHRKTLNVDDQVGYKFTVRVGQGSVDLEDIELKIDENSILDWISPVLKALKWIVENWEEIEGILEDLGDIFGQPPLDEDVGKAVQQIRAKSDVIRQETEAVLDGSWQSEAAFIVYNIAIVAASVEIARQRPPFLPLPASKAPNLVADPNEPTKASIKIKNVGAENIVQPGRVAPQGPI